jgi:SAM-dependent methyltransferase
MTTSHEFREQVRVAWTAPSTVAAWVESDQQWADCSAAMTEALVCEANPRPGQRVLELATGSGVSARALAAAVAPTGKVVATDLSAGMTSAAGRIALDQRISNLTAEQADVHELPYRDAEFDLVTSRLGAMFFADEAVAHAQIRRVLRMGGRAVHLVWGSGEDGFLDATLGTLARHVKAQPPPASAPSPFRYQAPGSLPAVMDKAGFTSITEKRQQVTLVWNGNAKSMCRWWLAVAASPLGRLVAALPADDRKKAEDDITNALSEYHHDGRTHVPAEIALVSGTC